MVHRCYVATGRVQGVNYRARVLDAATRHRLVGRVSNQPDGTVLIDVQGPVEAVEAFLRDVSGPGGLSHARSVQRVAELPISSERTGFAIDRE